MSNKTFVSFPRRWGIAFPLGKLGDSFAQFLMAMAGAAVIKIEAPHGDRSRRRGGDGDYPFRALNACKRAMVLNLKAERGRERLLKLCRDADVLVENLVTFFLKTEIEKWGRAVRAPGARPEC